MKEKFEDRKLTGKINVACKFDDGSVRYWTTTKEEVVSHIVAIVAEYKKDGYILTLRQLHYQFVGNNWIVNHDTAYKKLGSILDDCRYGGIIDWNAIEDRGRTPYIPYSVNDVENALQDTIDQYRLNRQEGQTNVVELWTEKDALSGILKRTTQKYHIQLVVNKGYTSSSAIYGAYQRFVQNIIDGKKVTVLYFGDHDPSGLDMIRDIRERLTLFLTKGSTLKEKFYDTINEWWEKSNNNIYDLIDAGYCSQRISDINNWSDDVKDDYRNEFESGQIAMYLYEKEVFKVIAIGLTMQQIKQYNLPPNPTKVTDSRANKYIKQFGKTCWEVDALKPQVLTAIVETNIKSQIDIDMYENMIERENEHIAELEEFIKNR